MDVFELIINKEKFASTNKLWNDMKLNRPWLIGGTSSLIQQATFKSKEEWKHYYFSTGEKRLEEISKLKHIDQVKLKSFEELNQFKCSSNKINKINTEYGRTQNELNQVADIFYGALIATGNPKKLTRSDCRYIIHFRVIGETWNGIMIREVNTLEVLSGLFDKEYSFRKIDGYSDVLYEVDAEVFYKNKLICALQIKPESYKKKFDSADEIVKINKNKNKKYSESKNVPIFYVYSETNGAILNKEVLNEIAEQSTEMEMEKNGTK